MSPNGYTGKVLWVDLSSGTTKEETPDASIYRKFLGGYGLGAYFAYTRGIPRADPLGPENILSFCPGLLTGSAAPFTGRHMVCAKSPLTGTWGDSNCGGYFGPAIRRAGYDAILFKGHAEKWSYLLVDERGPSIASATVAGIEGKDIVATEVALKKIHGNAAAVECIGIAGEKQSLISGIVTDRGRIAARGGLGAVMGAKKLKALCLKGTVKLGVADKERTLALSTAYREKIERHKRSATSEQTASMAPKMASLYRMLSIPTSGDEFLYTYTLNNYGTAFATSIYSETGDMPIKNFKGVGFTDWPQKVAQQFAGLNLKKWRIKQYGCFGCPLKCGAILEVPEAGLEETHVPEYETLAALGGMILNPDIVTTIEANHFLNMVGMDTISAGNVIAFVLECVERGILKKDDFKCKAEPGGFLPRWNQPDHVLPLLRLMASREGIGDVLSDGVKRAAERIGKGSAEFAMHVHGQELPMHDARYCQGLGLTYVADPTPGRHTAACLDFSSAGPVNKFLSGLDFKNASQPIEKGRCQAKFTSFRQAFNALGLCEYALPLGTYPLLELVEAVTGWPMSVDELVETGRRVQALRQAFNAREGAIGHYAPGRALGRPPMGAGPLKSKSVPIEGMLEGYYEALGFDGKGVPTRDTLVGLGLDFCLDIIGT